MVKIILDLTKKQIIDIKYALKFFRDETTQDLDLGVGLPKNTRAYKTITKVVDTLNEKV